MKYLIPKADMYAYFFNFNEIKDKKLISKIKEILNEKVSYCMEVAKYSDLIYTFLEDNSIENVIPTFSHSPNLIFHKIK